MFKELDFRFRQLSQINNMQYLPAPRTFAPYLKDKFCHSIRNDEETLIEFIKGLKPILQTDAYGYHRRNAGISDADIDIGENGGKNRYGGTNRDCHTNSGEYHCRAGAFAVTSGYNNVRGPANSREGARQMSVRRT